MGQGGHIYIYIYIIFFEFENGTCIEKKICQVNIAFISLCAIVTTTYLEVVIMHLRSSYQRACASERSLCSCSNAVDHLICGQRILASLVAMQNS
jgi:hypothetical protein